MLTADVIVVLVWGPEKAISAERLLYNIAKY